MELMAALEFVELSSGAVWQPESKRVVPKIKRSTVFMDMLLKVFLEKCFIEKVLFKELLEELVPPRVRNKSPYRQVEQRLRGAHY